ncbi:MAG: hypothetical protein ABSE71_01760 [Candidatus Micrarchaeaceae archaeon]|nr:hypothetical protein [Candidatus Micrarchaeota archaeon]HII10271.1 hypothetical protein [Candidatus Micrarchaeota archaeon]
MPARVYVCEKSEAEELKRVLAYDPYLDTNLIPPSVTPKDKKESDLTDEERRQIAEREKVVSENLKKLGESPQGRIIFTRQEYSLRDGASLGLDENMVYLYISASDDFLNGAEERFKKEFKTIKRAGKEDEEKVIGAIKEEEERANTGFGSIFGN